MVIVLNKDGSETETIVPVASSAAKICWKIVGTLKYSEQVSIKLVDVYKHFSIASKLLEYMYTTSILFEDAKDRLASF